MPRYMHDDVISEWLTKERCLTFLVRILYFLTLLRCYTFNSFFFSFENEPYLPSTISTVHRMFCNSTSFLRAVLEWFRYWRVKYRHILHRLKIHRMDAILLMDQQQKKKKNLFVFGSLLCSPLLSYLFINILCRYCGVKNYASNF